MKLSSVFVFIAVLSAQVAYAIPLLSTKDAKAALMSPNFTAQYDFEGIVALSNCSGSLIRLENSKDSDKAMVLTNGH